MTLANPTKTSYQCCGGQNSLEAESLQPNSPLGERINDDTFYLLIFLWTDSKSRITREIHAVKNPESFMITRAKLSAVRANSFVVVNNLQRSINFGCHCLRIGGAALIRGRRSFTFLSQIRRLFE